MNNLYNVFNTLYLGHSLAQWGGFLLIVLVLILFDLGVMNGRNQVITVKKSLWQSLFYIVISFLYGAWIWITSGSQPGQEYFTGYLIEKTLSLDNVFVISLIFTYFKIPLQAQHRVLFLGILGVLIFRALMIGAGAALIGRFEWLTYIFSIFLIFTGLKIFTMPAHTLNLEENHLLKVLKKYLPLSPTLHKDKFFVRIPHSQGRQNLAATPLFLALCLVEFTDVIFALDSIPAIFTITRDPYIVYTSNIFAILGLRALYYAVAHLVNRFIYLQYSLGLILIFIGSKTFISYFMGLPKFPASLSLTITGILILGGIGASYAFPTQKLPKHKPE